MALDNALAHARVEQRAVGQTDQHVIIHRQLEPLTVFLGDQSQMLLGLAALGDVLQDHYLRAAIVAVKALDGSFHLEPVAIAMMEADAADGDRVATLGGIEFARRRIERVALFAIDRKAKRLADPGIGRIAGDAYAGGVDVKHTPAHRVVDDQRQRAVVKENAIAQSILLETTQRTATRGARSLAHLSIATSQGPFMIEPASAVSGKNDRRRRA